MTIQLGELAIWIIVGALAGSFAGMVATRTKRGLGRWANLGTGLVGAVIGGAIVNLFNLDFGLGDLAVTADDLVAAFGGSVVFLVVIRLVKRWRAHDS